MVRKMRQEKAIQKAEEDMQVCFIVVIIACFCLYLLDGNSIALQPPTLFLFST